MKSTFDRTDGTGQQDSASIHDAGTNGGLSSFPPITIRPGPRFTQHEINTFEALIRPLISNPRPSPPFSATNNTTATSATTTINGMLRSNNSLSCVTKPSTLSRSVYGRPAAASMRSRDYILKDWNWNDGVCTCDLCRAPSSTCAACRKNALGQSHQPKSVKGCDCNLCTNNSNNNHNFKAVENNNSNSNNNALLTSNEFIPSFGMTNDRGMNSNLLLLNNQTASDSNMNGEESKSRNNSGSSSSDSSSSVVSYDSGNQLIFDTLQTLQKTESKAPANSLPLLPPTPAPITSRLTRLMNEPNPSQKSLKGDLSSSSASISSSFSQPCSFSSSFSSLPSTTSSTLSSFTDATAKESTSAPSTSFGSNTQDAGITTMPVFNFPAPDLSKTGDIFKPSAAAAATSFGDGFSSLKSASSFFPAPIAETSSTTTTASGSKGKRRKGGEDDTPEPSPSAKKLPSFSFGTSAPATAAFSFDFTGGASSNTLSSSTTSSFGLSAATTPSSFTFETPQTSSFANAFNPSTFGSAALIDTEAFSSGSFSASGFPTLAAPTNIGFSKGGKAVKARKYASRNNLDVGMKLYGDSEESAEFANGEEFAEENGEEFAEDSAEEE